MAGAHLNSFHLEKAVNPGIFDRGEDSVTKVLLEHD